MTDDLSVDLFDLILLCKYLLDDTTERDLFVKNVNNYDMIDIRDLGLLDEKVTTNNILI